MNRLAALSAVVVIGVAAASLLLIGVDDVKQPAAGPFTAPSAIKGPIAIDLPARLSPKAQQGEKIFAAKCAACHGQSGVGTTQGPPLVHLIYEPSHHNDGSFFRAVLNGMRGHHWKFGDMPPVQGVARSQIPTIIAYIRELQRANGVN